MFLIAHYITRLSKMLWKCITYSIKTTITTRFYYCCLSISLNCNFCLDTINLLEMDFWNLEYRCELLITPLKYLKNLICCKFLMVNIRYIFNSITKVFSHSLWNNHSIIMLKNISNSALTWLAVNSDYVWVICTSNIFWINWKIWNCPLRWILFNSIVHTFRYGILMWTRECCKYKLTTIWVSVIYLHLCKTFKHLCKLWHIRKIQFRVNALCVHIHSKINNIHITSSLTIAK